MSPTASRQSSPAWRPACSSGPTNRTGRCMCDSTADRPTTSTKMLLRGVKVPVAPTSSVYCEFSVRESEMLPWRDVSPNGPWSNRVRFLTSEQRVVEAEVGAGVQPGEAGSTAR